MRAPTALFLCSVLMLGAVLRAQQADSDADKRKQFLKAREEMRTVPATPAPAAPPEATPRPKPKPRPAATPSPDATPRPRPDPDKPRGKPTPLLVITPKPAPVTPAPKKTEEAPPAPVNIEKTSINQQDILPAEPETSGRWWWSPQKYNYLTRSVRDAIDNARVARNRWRYLVVHNSGTRQGSAKAFDYYHLHVRKMPNGLAYHFVIGNGSSTGDGEIEIGNRWKRQINGGHVHSDYLNNIALGICLVGDYNRDTPTERQKAALEELLRYLRKRVGKIDGKQSIVKAHREINPPKWPTDCPGNKFPYSWLHGKFD